MDEKETTLTKKVSFNEEVEIIFPPHIRQVIASYEEKKMQFNYGILEIAYKENLEQYKMNKKRLNNIENKLNKIGFFSKLFRKKKIALLKKEKQNCQKKNNDLETNIRTQYQTLGQQSIEQIKKQLLSQQSVQRLPSRQPSALSR